MGKNTRCFFRWLSKLLLLRRKHVRKKRSAAVGHDPHTLARPTHKKRNAKRVKSHRVAGAFLGRKAASPPSRRYWTRERRSGSDTNVATESPRGGHTSTRMDRTVPSLAVAGRLHIQMVPSAMFSHREGRDRIAVRTLDLLVVHNPRKWLEQLLGTILVEIIHKFFALRILLFWYHLDAGELLRGMGR